MVDELFREMAREAADLSLLPTDADSAKLRTLGMALVEADRSVVEYEDKLKEAKTVRRELQMETMPDAMKEIGQDVIGLPDAGCDLVLSAYYKASISSNWPVEDQEAAFAHLVDLGAGDLVKTVVTMQFGRSELNLARAVIALIRVAADNLVEAGVSREDIPLPVIQMAVPWSTLTSFVREMVEKGETIDLNILGATVGSIVKIKKRKDK